jgi:hypothetical protein
MAYQQVPSDECSKSDNKKRPPKSLATTFANFSAYFDSPLWWTYERRRLGLPRKVREITDRVFRRYELWRVSERTTRLFGPRFARSRNLIEIDLTYVCNLACPGCNRSCGQAPTNQAMTLAQIEDFISESVERDYPWDGIRLLGGEPSLHPQFHEMLSALRAYRDKYRPKLRLTVVSNGHGEKVEASLEKIPDDILVENTAKSAGVQVDFAPFNNAPSDHPEHARSDFSNGCWITQGLGMGLGPNGYYHCAVAGGIDRVYGFGMGGKNIPDLNDDMREQCSKLCALCGHFCIHTPSTTAEDGLSESWRGAYDAWERQVEVARQTKRQRRKTENAA